MGHDLGPNIGNSKYPDEMWQNAAFHQILHFLLRWRGSLSTEKHLNWKWLVTPWNTRGVQIWMQPASWLSSHICYNKMLYVSENNYLSPLNWHQTFKETHIKFFELQTLIWRPLLYTEVFLKQIAIHILVHVRTKCHIFVSLRQIGTKL